jgi:hypothetical protein
MTGTLHEDQYVFLIISCSFLFRIKIVQTKLVEEIKIHFMFSNFFFTNCAIYEIMWKNIV